MDNQKPDSEPKTDPTPDSTKIRAVGVYVDPTQDILATGEIKVAYTIATLNTKEN